MRMAGGALDVLKQLEKRLDEKGWQDQDLREAPAG